MTREQIQDKIRANIIIKDEKECLACGKAFEIASELGIEPSEIGKVCNGLKIKIVACQLGCFK
ncbi:hypothetical protein JW890_02030 [candidate division WOR-3 bacterium]|nr:hypothetical protein [candidate division WOR-3 bacterium]